MAHRYRLYPTPQQKRVFEMHGSHARLVWNAALEQRSWWRPGRDSPPGHYECIRQLAEARAELGWLAAGSSSVQQVALRDLDRALRSWWAGTHRRPRWRKRGRRDGFCVRDVRVRKLNRTWAEVTAPKTGRVRLRLSRPLPGGKLGMARITHDGKGRWHIAIPAPQAPVRRQPTGAAVGIDRGVVNTLAMSDGRMLRAPVMRKRERRRLQRLQRQFVRQRTGSAGRRRTKARIAALHQAVADRRGNWIERQTTRLVSEYDVICVEDLHVSRMLRRPAAKPDPDASNAFLPNGARAKSRLNRAIIGQGWSRWLRRLDENASASGITVVRVDPRHTSRQCRQCGHASAENRESQAVFACQRCGHEAKTDRHAAENVLARGSTPSRTPPDRGQSAGSLALLAQDAELAQREPPERSLPMRSDSGRGPHGSQPWGEAKLPRYRTLDGDEVDLPLAMDQWVLVPRALARFDPELAWALDYEDAPEPEGADPRLDFSAGALLVPVERWDEHAALEPNLAPCRAAAPSAVGIDADLVAPAAAPRFNNEPGRVPFAAGVIGAVGRAATVTLAVLAVGYVVAVAAWLWSLRHRVAGPDVSTGLLLIGAAMLLAWLAGIAGAVPGATPPASVRGRSWGGRGTGIGHRLVENPVAILRLGLVVQLAGFFALDATR